MPTQDNLEKLRTSKPSPRVVTLEDAARGREADGTNDEREYQTPLDRAMMEPKGSDVVHGEPAEFISSNSTQSAQKIALFNAAWSLYLSMRPKITFPDLPKAPNTSSPLEAKTDYAKALSAQLQTAQEYAGNESKALWKKLFDEVI